jgi:hypothetical protein
MKPFCLWVAQIVLRKIGTTITLHKKSQKQDAFYIFIEHLIGYKKEDMIASI